MRRSLICLIIILSISFSSAWARSLDLTYQGNGISFGNSKRINGLRFNLVDKNVEKNKWSQFHILDTGRQSESGNQWVSPGSGCAGS